MRKYILSAILAASLVLPVAASADDWHHHDGYRDGYRDGHRDWHHEWHHDGWRDWHYHNHVYMGNYYMPYPVGVYAPAPVVAVAPVYPVAPLVSVTVPLR